VLKLNNSSKNKWDSITEKFCCSDIYFKSSYLFLCSLHGKGEPMLFYSEEKQSKICLVALKNDISDSIKFKNLIKKNEFYDLSTPYGYGGFLVENEEKNHKFLDDFFAKFNEYCQNNNIVSLFLRFHPLLENHKKIKNFCNIFKIKQTIYISTENQEEIVENMSSKCRNTVRKAQKLGVVVDIDDKKNKDELIKIYLDTMKRNNASKYYYFNKKYFNYLAEDMKNNAVFFCAKHKEKLIAFSIILYDNNTSHYHLSGTKEGYKNFAANDLILFQAAVWSCERGIKKFHLGGGLRANDNLFAFKKKFNKQGALDFYVGKIIFDEKKFCRLVKLRSINNENFNPNDMIITYRG
jgi:hypothetical protein